MKSNWQLDLKSVNEYRFLYYEHYIPLIKSELSENEALNKMNDVLTKINWTKKKFLDFKSIDLMQRLVFEYSHDLSTGRVLTSKEEYRVYDPNFGALRLKDNSKSSDPDKLHS